MAVEASGHSRGNPRIYELVEHAPKEGKSPTIWTWPALIDYFKVAGQPVQGPWPPHQQPRPDPAAESLPVAVRDPQSFPPRATPQGAIEETPLELGAPTNTDGEPPTWQGGS